MKTLSIRQPWADLIIRGIKDVENRTWTTKYRGPVLVHASKALVAGPAIDRFYGPDHEWEHGGFIGIVDLVDVVTESDSPWANNEPYQWVFANPRRVAFVPENGKLNLYETPWPSSLPVGRVHRRDERVPTPETLALGGGRLPAVAVVAKALSKERFFAIAHELLEDLSPDHQQAMIEFADELSGSFAGVLDLMTLDDLNVVLAHVGQKPRADVATAIAALAYEIATEDDLADDPEEDVDEEGDEDGENDVDDEEEDADDVDEEEDADDVDEEEEDAEDVDDEEAGDVEDAQPERVVSARPSVVLVKAATADITSIDVDLVMAAFRQAARGQGSIERIDLLRLVSRELGYARLGSTIEETLRGHLRAAVRRRIIEADGQLVRLATTTIDDYTMEELREFLVGSLRRGQRIEREEVMRQTVQHLGFRRVTDNVRAAFKSAFNSAIRQGLLESEGADVVVRS